MDIKSITYTDDEGEQRNCWDYLMQDGDLACFSSHGRYTSDCAVIAILLFLVYVDNSGEDTVDLLDGCMSDVVNDRDGITGMILDSRHVFGDDTDAYDYFDEDQIREARELYRVHYCGEAPGF